MVTLGGQHALIIAWQAAAGSQARQHGMLVCKHYCRQGLRLHGVLNDLGMTCRVLRGLCIQPHEHDVLAEDCNAAIANAGPAAGNSQDDINHSGLHSCMHGELTGPGCLPGAAWPQPCTCHPRLAVLPVLHASLSCRGQPRQHPHHRSSGLRPTPLPSGPEALTQQQPRAPGAAALPTSPCLRCTAS